MAGSARGLVSSHFSAVRVGGLDYYPAHSKNGQNISQRLVITTYLNQVSNGKEKRMRFKLTAWNKLADTLAKCLSKGKEFSAVATPQQFEGRVFVGDTPLTLNDGTPVMTDKVSWTIREISLGADSEKTISAELAEGTRPVGWEKEGTQAREMWRQVLRARMNATFDPNSKTFGFARVRLPQGPGIGAYIPNQSATNGAAPVPGQIAKDVFNAAVNVGQVAQAAPVAAPAAAPAAPANPFGAGLGY